MKVRRNSTIWLAGAALAFAAAVLLFTPLRVSLIWDETIYASQISQHVPAMQWGAERARGMPLLVAPVTLLTDSASVLRIYLALLGGVGLFLALLAWRGLKPAWVLALSGLIFGGLGITQLQTTRVFPNFWIALGGLATVGLFLQGLTERLRLRIVVVLLALAVAFTALMRPADAVFIVGPLVVAAVIQIARRSMVRRSAYLIAAIVAGLAVGGGEWAAEAYVYFNGPYTRLRESARVVGGTKFDPANNLRIINGGRDSSLAKYPGYAGWSHPRLLIWWFVFLALALIGVYVASRNRGWLLAAIPAVCSFSVFFLYTLPVRDNARYLLPAWALLAIPAADAVAWLITSTKGRVRLAATAAVGAFLAVEFLTQHAVLIEMIHPLESTASAEMVAANALHNLGVRAPCVVTSLKRPNFAEISEPVAFYSGCTYTWSLRHISKHAHSRVTVLVLGKRPPWPYAQDWPAHKLGGTGVFAYIEPATQGSITRPAQKPAGSSPLTRPGYRCRGM